MMLVVYLLIVCNVSVVGGEMASMRPLYKAINCVLKVEAILDRKFLKPPFRETIKPPGPGKLFLKSDR